MPKETKATDPEMEQRISFVFEGLVKGILTTEMWEYVVKEHSEWNVSRSTVYRYVKLAKKKLAELAKRQKKYHLGKSLARLEMLFQRNITVQDYNGALQADKERNKLMGLYEQDNKQKAPALAGVVTIEVQGTVRPPTTREQDVPD